MSREAPTSSQAPSLLSLPVLPDHYSVQHAAGFHDPSGRVSYELMRVYGPLKRLADRPLASASALDRELTYWVSSWPFIDEKGVQRAGGRAMSFAQARTRLSAQLSFDDFSSLPWMREQLPALLGP